MASRDDLEGLIQNANDLSQVAPGWTDRLIIDYLARLRSLVTLADAIDEVGSEVTNVYSTLKTEIVRLSNEQAVYEAGEGGPKFVQFRPISKSVRYTALDFDFIEANNSAKIKLPQYPDDASEVIVANGDGSMIVVDGNGKKFKVKGLTDDVLIKNQGTSLHFQYFAERGYWRIR